MFVKMEHRGWDSGQHLATASQAVFRHFFGGRKGGDVEEKS